MSVRHALLALLSEGPEVRAAAARGVRGADRRGVAAERGAGVHDAAAARARRAGGVRRRRGGRARRRASGSPPTARQELAGWLRTPPDLASPPRDELVIKVLVALRVPGTDVHEVIQVHRRYLVELMQQWTRIKEDEAEHDLSLALVVDAELFRLDSVIRWLDAADGRLKRAAAERLPGGAAGSPIADGCGATRRGYGDDRAGAARCVEGLRRRARPRCRRCATSTCRSRPARWWR